MNTSISNLTRTELLHVLVLITSRHYPLIELDLKRDIMTDLNIDEKGYQDFKEQSQHHHQLYLDATNDPSFMDLDHCLNDLLADLSYRTANGHPMYSS